VAATPAANEIRRKVYGRRAQGDPHRLIIVRYALAVLNSHPKARTKSARRIAARRRQQAMLYGATTTTCIATPRARHISSDFLRCALLAPNMHSMFSRGGVLGVQWATRKDVA